MADEKEQSEEQPSTPKVGGESVVPEVLVPLSYDPAPFPPSNTSVPPPGSTSIPPEEGGHIMTVVEHLDELRTRIIRSLVILMLAFFVALLFGKDALRILELPAGGITIQALSVEEPMVIYFKVSLYGALIIACPWILWEVCQFMAPGLKSNERKILSPIIFGSPLLFVAGAAFAYFAVLPPMLHFFKSFGEGVSPINQRLDFYISLVTSIMMYMGLCFQLPIIIFALALAGLVNSTMLIKIWRYAIFGASVVALIITPDPTAFSMLIVMAALVGLYFLSVGLLKIFGK